MLLDSSRKAYMPIIVWASFSKVHHAMFSKYGYTFTVHTFSVLEHCSQVPALNTVFCSVQRASQLPVFRDAKRALQLKYLVQQML